MSKLVLHYITLTNYDPTFNNVKALLEKEDLRKTIGEVISRNNKSQVRIAETEKYPHVTYFFSGGREEKFNLEKRLLCPSPKVATYDLQPEMSAFAVKDAMVKELETNKPDFVCLNFANPDMVGHTGIFEAAVKACETIDVCSREVIETALKQDYSTIIIADHGNSDYMINPDGSPNTAHTTNPVPCILVENDSQWKLKDGKLGDIAPTILKLMDLAIPDEMTGETLVDE